MGDLRLGDLLRMPFYISIVDLIDVDEGLVSLIDVDETLPGAMRLVLELCEGGELYDRIQQKQYYPEHEALKSLEISLLKAFLYPFYQWKSLGKQDMNGNHAKTRRPKRQCGISWKLWHISTATGSCTGTGFHSHRSRLTPIYIQKIYIHI